LGRQCTRAEHRAECRAAALRRSRRRPWPGRTSCTLSSVEYCGNAGVVQWLQLKVVHSCAWPSRGARARQLAWRFSLRRAKIAAALEISHVSRARMLLGPAARPRERYGCGHAPSGWPRGTRGGAAAEAEGSLMTSSVTPLHTYLSVPSPKSLGLPRGGDSHRPMPMSMKTLHGPGVEQPKG